MSEQYMHGGDIYRNHVEYDFSVNINPLGMPEESVKAAQRGVLLCAGYPDYKGEALCREIAGAEGVKEPQIILGNGAAELIYALCNAIRPKTGLICAPSFQEYEAAVVQAGEGLYSGSFRRRRTSVWGGMFCPLSQRRQISYFCAIQTIRREA